MSQRQLLGHTTCPACSSTAEVRRDRAGHPFIRCPHCGHLSFTHGAPAQVALLAMRTRPVKRARSALARSLFQVHALA